MRRGTGFDANQARRQLLEEDQHVPALQLTAQGDIALRINAVNLKHGLRDIETDCRDCLHGWLSESWGLNSTHWWRSRPQHQKQTLLRSVIIGPFCASRAALA